MPTENDIVLAALKDFSGEVKTRLTATIVGEPEDQLRGPFEHFLGDSQIVFRLQVTPVGEVLLPRLGKPDYALHVDGVLAGYAELKAPGKGANPDRYRGHDKRQWERFKDLPNILYSDGNEWALYRNGERIGNLIRFSGDIVTDGREAVAQQDAQQLTDLLRNFLMWEPQMPSSPRELASILAPLCRMLRDDVIEALHEPESSLQDVAQEWRVLLFPDADDRRFADAYAQTVTFSLLLAKSYQADTLSLEDSIGKLRGGNGLLAKALQVLSSDIARGEIIAPLSMLQRVIARIPDSALSRGRQDPWLYFYEDFLAEYDPNLRKNAGAYYTPVEVVRCQVRLVDSLLSEKLGKRLGFADPEVVTLDPAVGTGTYLLGVVEHALAKIEAEEGPGAVAPRAESLANNIYGFEYLVGPYAVAELRLSRMIHDYSGHLPQGGVHVYLTDTLESPFAEPPQRFLLYREMAEQHIHALKVKDEVPVIVCIGNPPYDRHDANDRAAGGWVRHGDSGTGAQPPILDAFIRPASEAGLGVHLKNLYNLYAYFWRWALWKIFESRTAQGPGIVSFITASSYLDGPAFAGMRKHIREICDEVWIVDLGGDNRGTTPEENVFDIQTPVAIAIAIRQREPRPDLPALVRYTRIRGSREEKLTSLNSFQQIDSIIWEECPSGWLDSFKPAGTGEYFSWPLLTDLFPWQHTGVQLKRTWPIGPDKETLSRRWSALCLAEDKGQALRETGFRTIHGSYAPLFPNQSPGEPIANVKPSSDVPLLRRYAYRSFDRQWVFADSRLGDRLRPPLWLTYGPRQLFLSCFTNHPLGNGPALTCSAEVPDIHQFRGSYGGKDIIPLFLDKEGSNSNILPGVFDTLGAFLNSDRLTPENLAAYCYAMMAHPGYTARFRRELERRELRVPITKNPELFNKAVKIGRKLIWLHTYGSRLAPEGAMAHIQSGQARVVRPIPSSPSEYPEEFSYDVSSLGLSISSGLIAPVAPEIWDFDVSGLKPLHSWLKYRMKGGAGRTSSPLDDIRPQAWTPEFTRELLELIWVLEETTGMYSVMDDLLAEILAGETFIASELPAVPDASRQPPVTRPVQQQGVLA
ncbi:MAG: N-6 DNA methylase [Desulfovibrio sp.]|nr:N-6 DNA methylase [Desulfovibrio sp.]MBI4960822.1 N-6 DNA methylase [Desulfovibrio sp.]